jgi:hypothetical protein
MADYNSTSSGEDNPSDIDSENRSLTTDDEKEQTSIVDAEDTSFDYTTLATSLLNRNNSNFQLNTDKKNLIKGSRVNTIKYKQTKAGIENRLFDTIQLFGGNELKPLLVIITIKGIEEKRFYVIIHGRRNEHKLIILS